MHSGKCVSNTLYNGNPLYQFPCTSGEEVWYFSQHGWVSGMPVYEISSIYAGPSIECLDLTSNSFANGTLIQRWQCNNGVAQRWAVGYFTTWNGQPVYELHPIGNTNKCLDVRDVSQLDGARLQLWDCFRPNGQANQLFYLPPY
jgi:hypothetical protein